MKVKESYIERTKWDGGKSYKVNERCDLLSELTGDDIREFYRERMTVEIDDENKIEMGMRQAAWSDEYWFAVGFRMKVNYDGINSFSMKQDSVIDGSSLAGIRKEVLKEKLNEIFHEPSGNGWGQLRWSGGAGITDTIMKTEYQGLVVVQQTTMLAD